MSRNQKILLLVGGLLVLCLCCCGGAVFFVSQAGYTQVNGICTSKGQWYTGKECPVVGGPVYSTSLNNY